MQLTSILTKENQSFESCAGVDTAGPRTPTYKGDSYGRLACASRWLFSSESACAFMVNDALLQIGFASVAAQSLLQGVFLSISLFSIYLMFQRRRVDKFVLAGVIILIINATAHWIISFTELYMAVKSQDAPRYLSDLRDGQLTAKLTLIDMSLAVTDLLLIYRLYIVWWDHPIIVVPPLLLLGGGIAGAASSVGLIQRTDDTRMDTFFEEPSSPAIIAAFVLFIALNAYCTAMISWRIWAAGRCLGRVGGADLSRSFAIFIESAGLYLTYLIISLVIYLLHHPVYFLLTDCNVVFSAIAYVMMNVRVALGVTREGAPSRPSALEWAIASSPTTPSSALLTSSTNVTTSVDVEEATREGTRARLAQTRVNRSSAEMELPATGTRSDGPAGLPV